MKQSHEFYAPITALPHEIAALPLVARKDDLLLHPSLRAKTILGFYPSLQAHFRVATLKFYVLSLVIPAKAGIHVRQELYVKRLDSRFRGKDKRRTQVTKENVNDISVAISEISP